MNRMTEAKCAKCGAAIRARNKVAHMIIKEWAPKVSLLCQDCFEKKRDEQLQMGMEILKDS